MTGLLGEVRETTRLGLPLGLIQLAQGLIGMTIVAYAGRLGADALAAAALAQSIYFTVWMFGMGLVAVVAPLVARALGGGRAAEPGLFLRQGLWVAALFAVPAIALVYHGEHALRAIGQTPANAAAAGEYLRVTCFGILPSLCFGALRGYVSAHGRTGSIFAAVCAGIAINAVVAWIAMFGLWGIGDLGLRGAGFGNIAGTCGMALLLLARVKFSLRAGQAQPFSGGWRPEPAVIGEMLRLGLPVGAAMVLEVSSFSACLQLMGLIGTAELAAHQIALQIATIAFMLPVGIGQAATVRVGWFAGAGRTAEAARAGWVAAGVALSISAFAAALFLVAPTPLTGLFIDTAAAENMAVVRLTAQFLVVVAAFQLVDAGQVTMQAALRGLKDTTVPMIIAFMAYWPLGVGLAWLLGFHTDLRGIGIWIASAIGLGFAAILLTWRFARLTRHAQAAA